MKLKSLSIYIFFITEFITHVFSFMKNDIVCVKYKINCCILLVGQDEFACPSFYCVGCRRFVISKNKINGICYFNKKIFDQNSEVFHNLFKIIGNKFVDEKVISK